MSYSKLTINHKVDNKNRNDKQNEKYKEIVRKNAIDYMRYQGVNIDEKIKYMRNLTTDCYRHGTKYKYDCNFSTSEVSSILKEVGDDDLYKAYFGKTIQESNSQNIGCLVILMVFIFLTILIMLFAK